MPSTHTSLHYHLIFATKNRKAWLAPAWREQLHEYLGGTVRGLDGHPQGVGGVADHVHLLVSLKATHCLADFMRELKKASSTWVREAHRQPDFHWQEGYAAFTVSASALDSVRGYIARQEAHHQKEPFRNELLAFLQKSGVEFDARYLD
ncbi:MAG: IS200/IS605 family transposase [Gammaproteobacteria bacterium]|nr:IS200/IS605 family transposase [Gammaproteobacteria bacterium]